jgi:predicted glycosyltransferase
MLILLFEFLIFLMVMSADVARIHFDIGIDSVVIRDNTEDEKNGNYDGRAKTIFFLVGQTRV